MKTIVLIDQLAQTLSPVVHGYGVDHNMIQQINTDIENLADRVTLTQGYTPDEVERMQVYGRTIRAISGPERVAAYADILAILEQKLIEAALQSRGSTMARAY